MKNVESKLELMGNSMRQLDLDIQLSANKQERQMDQMSTSIKDLESKISTLKSQQNKNANGSFSSNQTNLPTNVMPSYQTPPQVQNHSSQNYGSTERPKCPVCSQAFDKTEIHAHIEGHFNEGSKVQTTVSSPPENSGFWSKLFKKKEEQPQQPQQQQQQQEINPPNYNNTQSPYNQPSTVVPAFYSPSGTVQYAQQPQQQYYQAYPMAPRN